MTLDNTSTAVNLTSTDDRSTTAAYGRPMMRVVATSFESCVGSWSARSPVCPLILAYEIPRFFLSRRPSVCLSVRIRSTESTDRK